MTTHPPDHDPDAPTLRYLAAFLPKPGQWFTTEWFANRMGVALSTAYVDLSILYIRRQLETANTPITEGLPTDDAMAEQLWRVTDGR